MNREEFVNRQIEDVYHILHHAKECGDYDIANIAFCVLLSFYFEYLKFEIEWETQDPDGECESEGYYDVITLVDKVSGVTASCIPQKIALPSLLAILKSAKKVERKVHNRKINENVPKALLYQCLIDTVGLEKVSDSVFTHLVYDNTSEDVYVRYPDLMRDENILITPTKNPES